MHLRWWRYPQFFLQLKHLAIVVASIAFSFFNRWINYIFIEIAISRVIITKYLELVTMFILHFIWFTLAKYIGTFIEFRRLTLTYSFKLPRTIMRGKLLSFSLMCFIENRCSSTIVVYYEQAVARINSEKMGSSRLS